MTSFKDRSQTLPSASAELKFNSPQLVRAYESRIVVYKRVLITFWTVKSPKTICDHCPMHLPLNLITYIELGHWATGFLRKYWLSRDEFWLHSDRKKYFRPIKTSEIKSTRCVDTPRYPVYCLDPSEHRDLTRNEKSFFFDKKKTFLRGVQALPG